MHGKMQKMFLCMVIGQTESAAERPEISDLSPNDGYREYWIENPLGYQSPVDSTTTPSVEENATETP